MSPLLNQRLEHLLWPPRGSDMPAWRKLLTWPARHVFALARDLAEGQLTLRAMSLVYTTLLSLVPLLAFSFSLLKGFGVHRQAEPLLYEFLQPLGEKGSEITAQIIGFVDNVSGGVLGGIGLALLVYTVISMIQKVEDTFNYIWQVQKSRSLARRFSDYLSVILVGPMLMVTAMGLLATVSSSTMMQVISEIAPFGVLLNLAGRAMPFAVVVLVFTFVYAFVPNTRVRLFAALAGALIAGAAWIFAGSLFAAVIVGSTRYAAIYSSFAIAIIALIWLYVSWLVLLLGAQVAFYVQYPRRLRLGRTVLQLSITEVEQLALGIMLEVGRGFRSGEHPGFRELARRLDCPASSLESITDRLEQAGLLLHTEDGRFAPGRDADAIRVVDILKAARGSSEALGGEALVRNLLGEIEAAAAARLGGRSLAEMVAAGKDAGPATPG
jgi:membrane protein